MMRTIEVFLVIVIITGAFLIASFYAVLPVPRRVSPLNLRRLALTTLQILDADYSLSTIAFKDPEDPSWNQLQVALSALLPPNIVYNLTVYIVRSEGGEQLYTPLKSISNAESLGIQSEASSYLVASSNVTFRVIPEKIGERQGTSGTLYILNCSDARGWWITGYTAHTLAQDLYNLLSPYFKKTVMVQSTSQLARILNGTALEGETLQGAVVINTFGETVPIPSGYYARTGVGRDSNGRYSMYCYTLGQRVRQYNWTWVSIVGYPLYYVSNTNLFPDNHNDWGIYGMRSVGAAGFNAFLRGLNGMSYTYDDTWITNSLSNPVYLSSESIYYCNYYGIYPAPYQTATRALPSSITNTYNLRITNYIFNPSGGWLAGAVFRHTVSGGFLALGLTRTPDIRLTALGLLCAFKPRLYRSVYTAVDATRLVVLQLGQVGGV
ncbi:MAG: hypothetical protein NZ932_03145 [Candidatus Bathyarchaeota archaeon]|nr:hypothetical protein [Candidatus Bathyarchaeota archaeon]MDW8040147.1 hypothetical protein [Nitrososphaerota archaeon]